MATQIDISQLSPRTPIDQLREYAESIPDGKAVELRDVGREINLSNYTVRTAARQANLLFRATASTASGYRYMIANSKTVQKWQDAQENLKPRKR